ncbi:MAG: PEGA domain-containing protein [Fluviicola sp.]|nr:PEGA domain-containing protein [Fluviicola sp.]
MKTTLFFFFLLLVSNRALSQSAYIQVNGEANLSVFLNGKMAGKTTAELGGLIIENVTAGNNLIKVVKEGFTPFEETITIKPGEVFAYKVKPFTKHVVNISEEGNSGETDNKATIKTGNLVIQSVPIEIKITIPDIEGINNMPKTKDKWQADKIPAGIYDITFTFNQKVISKQLEIVGDDTTSIFINMLNGEFKTTNTQDIRKENERLEQLKVSKVEHFCDSLFAVYKFNPRMKRDDFWLYNAEARAMKDSKKCENPYSSTGITYSLYNNKYNHGPGYICFDAGYELVYYSYTLYDKQRLQAEEFLKTVKQKIEATVPKEYIRRNGENLIGVYYAKYNIHISYYLSYDFETSLVIRFDVLGD